jgi:hypothetical protein
MFDFYRRFFPNRQEERESSELEKLLAETPLAQDILRQRENERIDRIRNLSAEMKRIVASRDSVMPGLRDKVAAAAADEKNLTEQLEAARKRHANLDLDRLGESLQFQAKISSLEGEIKALAPLATREFVHDAWTLIYHLSNELTIEERSGPKNRFSEKADSFTLISNKEALDEAMIYLRAAIREAEKMAQDGIHCDQIGKRLDELRQGIPDVKRLKHSLIRLTAAA